MHRTLTIRSTTPWLSARFAARLLALIAALFSLLLGACGGSGSDAPDLGLAEPANSRSATLGAAGGRITATASNGVRYTLAVPPGALAANTAITLTPLASIGASPLAAGLRGAVRFAPSGLKFAEPATLLIEGADVALPAGRRLVAFSRSDDGARTSLALPETSRGVISMPVFHFSDGGASAATEEEVNQLPELKPLATPAKQLLERMYDSSARSLPDGPASAEAAFYRDVFQQFVRPALDAGLASTEDGPKSEGLDAYSTWRYIVRAGSFGNVAAVEALLTDELRIGNEAATQFSRFFFEFQLDRCAASALGEEGALELYRIMLLRLDMANLGIDTVASALDPATTLRRVRDCARVVIDPAALPAVIRPGTSFSLDLRAGLVFAAAAQTVERGEFAFGITGSNATLPANANGFSDGQGRFTTVASPTAEQPVFQVQACYMFPSQGLTPLAPTDLCTTQQVGTVVGDGILRGTVTVTARVNNTGLSQTLDANAQVEVNLRTGASRIVSKFARFDSQRSNAGLGPVQPIGPGDCLVRESFSGNQSQSGSSFRVELGDTGRISVSGSDYTLGITGIEGIARVRGSSRVVRLRVSGDCSGQDIGAVRTSNIDDDLRVSYLPEGLRIEGSGKVERAADGRINIIGNRNFNEPGVGSFTLSWNLTGRL